MTGNFNQYSSNKIIPPANDDFANAEVLTGTTGLIEPEAYHADGRGGIHRAGTDAGIRVQAEGPEELLAHVDALPGKARGVEQEACPIGALARR